MKRCWYEKLFNLIVSDFAVHAGRDQSIVVENRLHCRLFVHSINQATLPQLSVTDGCENKKCEHYAECDSDSGSEARCICPRNCDNAVRISFTKTLNHPFISLHIRGWNKYNTRKPTSQSWDTHPMTKKRISSNLKYFCNIRTSKKKLGHTRMVTWWHWLSILGLFRPR